MHTLSWYEYSKISWHAVYNISNTTLIFPIFNKTNVILDSHCTFHKGNDRL